MRILVVDDHPVVREGLHLLLSPLPDAVIHQAESVDDAYRLFRDFEPHVTVLDINLDGSSGLEVLRRLKRDRPDAHVVMFTMYSTSEYVTRALNAGASGYVTKSADSGILVDAVVKVFSGERYLEPAVAHELAFNKPNQDLSDRELSILRLLGEGKSFAQIADIIGVSYKTIANAGARLKTKLGVDGTNELIRLSAERLHMKKRPRATKSVAEERP
jgi:DNA-binding NarL/FixJ family response regulator